MNKQTSKQASKQASKQTNKQTTNKPCDLKFYVWSELNGDWHDFKWAHSLLVRSQPKGVKPKMIGHKPISVYIGKGC